MSSKMIVKLGFKLAIVYSVIISSFNLITEGTLYIIVNRLNENNLFNPSPMESVLIGQVIIILVGLIVYYYIEVSINKDTKKLSILDSILLSQYRPIFNAFLGILVIVKTIVLLITLFSNGMYYHPLVEFISLEGYEDSTLMFSNYILRIIVSAIQGSVGLILLTGFKFEKK
ncbi:hypothetical protein [Alkaliphilus transvaalensis]|uniref:hypothetical protein n=1 Tax=Alkaliphilus transvaalensis TaxID=114628 RepID=UPI00047CB891|nr:hypothetical protein [Alkaliphilus transvaalensis]